MYEIPPGKTMSYELLPWLDKLYGWLEVLAILVGISLNSLTLRYFFKKKHQLSNLLFFLIAVNDLVILTACIPSAVSLLSNRRPVLFSSRAVCILAGFSFNIASRMSVFLIALLALARSVSLLRPLKLVRKRTYLVPLFIYFSLNVALASLPLIFSRKLYHYWLLAAQCSWGVNELSFVGGEAGTNYTATWHGMTYGTIIVPWFVPAVIVLVSCVLSLNALVKSGRKRRRMTAQFSCVSTAGRLEDDKSSGRRVSMKSVNHATITIVMATAVYILFNVPCWMFNVIILLSLRDQDVNKYFSAVTGIYLGYFMSILSVALNSASNPIIYFTRMYELRNENREIFERMVSRVKGKVSGVRSGIRHEHL